MSRCDLVRLLGAVTALTGCRQTPIGVDAAHPDGPYPDAGAAIAADAALADGGGGYASPDAAIAPPYDGPAVAPDGMTPQTADGPGPSSADAPATGGTDGPAPPPSKRALDLLFAIDNSPSMSQEQDNLARNFPALIDELAKIPGGLPDLHIGVVSSDLGAGPTPLMGGCQRVAGDRAILQVKPGCGLDSDARFIVSSDGGTVTNFQGQLSEVFGCMAKLGTQGCGYEHQLQSARVALYETVTPENKGFLRPEAVLAIVFVTDEDDCSAPIATDLFTRDMDFAGTTSSFRCAQVGHLCNGQRTPISEFSVPLAECQDRMGGELIKVSEIVDSIRLVKARPDQQILVSGIFGWPADPATAQYQYRNIPSSGIDYGPICSSANGEATAALRMKAFVDAFGANGSLSSICQDDFRPAMKRIGEALAGMLGP
jgi:hypothetical protein